MGSYQDVTIVCGEEALHLLEGVYKKYGFLPEKKCSGDFWMLEWWDVWWDKQFLVIDGIEQVLLQLDEIVTGDERFAYKQFIFDEDEEYTRVRVNDVGENPLFGYYVQRTVYDPEMATEDEMVKKAEINVTEELILFLKEFLRENSWREPLVQKQARAIFATVCMVGNIEPDTAECDNLLAEIYGIACRKEEKTDYKIFERYMVEIIV